MSRILIAEDEERIASFVEKGLRQNGFATTVVSEGRETLRLVASGDFELLILDLGLPGLDGLEVLREMRRRSQDLPVVILTARDTVDDIVAGLECGADDYVPKPFSFEELLARVRARLSDRRKRDEPVLTVGAASLDVRTRSATVEGRTVELSARELAMAEIFFLHPGRVLSRRELLGRVWGPDYDAGSNVVDVYVGKLRRKLGKTRIVTVGDLGYRLERDVPPPGSGRVLLVETEGRRADVRDGLGRGGHDVVVAGTDDTGRLLAATERFDVVVVVGVSGAPSADLLSDLAAGPPDRPVVLLTTHADPAARRRAEEAGAAHLIARPRAVDELCDLVRDRVGSGA